MAKKKQPALVELPPDLAARLPELCAVRMPRARKVVMVARGERGFYELPPDFNWVGFNERAGITPEQERAMLIGSMFGWDAPGADPDNKWPEMPDGP